MQRTIQQFRQCVCSERNSYIKILSRCEIHFKYSRTEILSDETAVIRITLTNRLTDLLLGRRSGN